MPHKSHPKFKYSKLPSYQTIRILILEPETPEDGRAGLKGELQEVDLVNLNQEKDGYEALSWAWGEDDGDNEEITLPVANKRPKHTIKGNLARCLRTLRVSDTGKVRRLWIDAICIDQKNDEEKNRQVAMMREIYRNATGVIVWLGDASDSHPPAERDLGATFSFIKERLLRRGLDQVTRDPDHFDHWKHLQQIMMKPWFNRRWIIQEIALAKKATVYCGNETLPWKEFSYAVSLFVDAEPALQLSNRARGNHFYEPDMFSEIGRTGAAELTELQTSLFRSSVQGPQSVATLEFLVSRLPMFECGTPHDAIYSLLAVARDTAPHSGNFWYAAPMHSYLKEFAEYKLSTFWANGEHWKLERLKAQAKQGRRAAAILGQSAKEQSYPVTYEEGEVDVFAHFMRFVIRSSGCLDMLCRPWAPRVREKQRTGEASTDTDDSEDDVADEIEETHNQAQIEEKKPVRLPSWIQDRHMRAFCAAPTTKGDDLTKIERRNADPLVGLPGRSMYHASGDIKASMRTVSFRRRSANDHSIFVKGFQIGVVAAKETHAAGGVVPRDWLTFAGWKDWQKDPPPELCRTLIANREPSRDHAGSTPPSYYDMVCKRILTPAFTTNSVNIDLRIAQTEDVLEKRFLRRMRAVVTERVLFYMKGKGLINDALGLGPKPSRSRHCVFDSARSVDDPIDGREQSRSRGGTADSAEAEQVTTEKLGVQKGDLICILYGCNVPVILRSYNRHENEVEQERENWRGRFAQRFLDGVVKVQRIFRLRAAFKKAIKSKINGPKQDKPENVENAIALDKNDKQKIKREVKRIMESIEQEQETEKRQVDPKTQNDNAVAKFNDFSEKLACLKLKHEYGTDCLGRPLPKTNDSEDDQGGTKAAVSCEQVKPIGKPQLTETDRGECKASLPCEKAGSTGRAQPIGNDQNVSEISPSCEQAESTGSPLLNRNDKDASKASKRCKRAEPTGEPLVIPDMPEEKPNPLIYYELVGECYIDGMMDGDALAARAQGPRERIGKNEVSDDIFEIR